MSTETQNHQEWVAQEQSREARQRDTDTLNALYDFPTAKQIAERAAKQDSLSRFSDGNNLISNKELAI